MEPTIQEKARALKNAYQRAWFKKHPGRNYEYQKKHWLKKAVELQIRPASCLPENQAQKS